MKNLSWKAILAGVGVILLEKMFLWLFLVLLSFKSITLRGGVIDLFSLSIYLTGGFLAARIAKTAIYHHAGIVWGIPFVGHSLLWLFFFVAAEEAPSFQSWTVLAEILGAFAGAYIYVNTTSAPSTMKSANPRQG